MYTMMKKIHLLVVEATKNNLQEWGNSVYISQQLKLSRNMVSQYLNQLFSEGHLIKINTRPAVFFDIKTIEEMYNLHIIQREFKSLQELQIILNPQESVDFDKLIGFDESLKDVVNQCKATISYPPNGLPLLLLGPTGSGKSFMAQLMYEYALNSQLITTDKNFLIVNCSEYANNPELLTANLFGYKKGAFTGADKDKVGLIKLAEGGLLFLDEVHCLKAECQEKLFLFMDKGIYHMVGDNEEWFHSNVRLLFATTEKPEEVLLKTLLRRIPIIVTIPSLEERSVHERTQLIYSIFKEEGKRIHKIISISTLVYQILLKTTFTGNIGELKNAIQASCVNALFQAKQECLKLEIHISNLPEKLLQEISFSNKAPEVRHQKMIPIHKLQHFIQYDKPIIVFHEKILSIFEEQQGLDNLLNASFKQIDEYHEIIILKTKKNLTKQDYVQGVLQSIFEMLSYRYEIKYVNNNIIAMSSYISDYMQNSYVLTNWKNIKGKEINKLNIFIRHELSREYAIAEEIRDNLNSNLDMEFDDMFMCVLTLTIKKLNQVQDLNKRIGIIIAHGFSTASSIADTANKLLGRYVFDAIDMQLHANSQEISEQLNHYLNKLGYFEELFLLVDMGSLENIYTGISNQHVNVGIMNNVTTKYAIEVGQGMIQGNSMQDIFTLLQKYSSNHYHIVEHTNREKVILCSCASGMRTAEKLKTILVDSLPYNLPIKVLTYDYNSLLEKKMHDSILKDYEVICIIGTLNPNIEGIRFIPIEELIINNTLDELNIYFKDYVDEKEMKTFQQNVLRNFTLSNIMNNLTILNPNKLLEYVAEAIDRLQSELDIRFTNNTCFGLYIHICCLIERLVAKCSIDIYTDIEGFAQKETVFIKSVKTSFSVVEKYYSVEIPVEEIGYIYNYVINN